MAAVLLPVLDSLYLRKHYTPPVVEFGEAILQPIDAYLFTACACSNECSDTQNNIAFLLSKSLTHCRSMGIKGLGFTLRSIITAKCCFALFHLLPLPHSGDLSFVRP